MKTPLSELFHERAQAYAQNRLPEPKHTPISETARVLMRYIQKIVLGH